MTKKIIIFSALFLVFAVGGFIFKPGISQASNQISKMDFEGKFTDSYGNATANFTQFGSFVSGHTGQAFRSSHAGDDGSGGDDFNIDNHMTGNELYVSYWLKYETTYLNTSHNTKWFWLDGSGAGHQELIFQTYDAATSKLSFLWQFGSPSSFSGGVIAKYFSYSPYKLGDWMHVEYYVKLSTGTTHLNPDGIVWFKINGNIVQQYTGVTTGAYSNKVGAPSINATANQASGHGWWQIDDYQVWDGLPSGSTTPPATCTSFTYSAFGTCQSNNTQSRTVTSSSPAGCTGGSPVLTQSCTYATCTESWTCGAWTNWSTCTNSSQSHTRTCTDSKNCGTTTTKPAITGSQSCTQVITYNLSNFTQLVMDWLKTIASSPADVNKDGKINSQDLGIMMSSWGQ